MHNDCHSSPRPLWLTNWSQDVCGPRAHWMSSAFRSPKNSHNLFGAMAAATILLSICATSFAAPVGNKRGIDNPGTTVALADGVAVRLDLSPQRLLASSTIDINLPSLGTAQLVTRSVEALASGNSRWTGVLKQGNQTFPTSLIATSTGVLGDIRTANGRFRLEAATSLGQSVRYWSASSNHSDYCNVSQIEQAPAVVPKSAPLAKAAQVAKATLVAEQLANGAKSADNASVDIMFVYTPRVADKYGAQLSAVLDDLVATANNATQNTKVPMTFQQVGAVKVSPQNIVAGDLVAALKAVASSDDPTLPANADFAGISAKRIQLGADIVVFLTAFGDYSVGCAAGPNCLVGAAWQTTIDSLSADDPGKHGYAVVDVAAQDLGLAVVHEIGHLLGAGHDAQTGGGGLFADSNGFRWNAGLSGDIMSYATNRELLFSNPALSCGTSPCGAPSDAATPADNSRALKSARFMVANFRAAKSAPVSDMAGLWSSLNDASSLHLSQRGRVITAVWTQFDDNGEPTWLMVPNCLINGRNCSGAMYRSWAYPESAANVPTLVPSLVMSSPVGAVNLDMTDPAKPSMRYDIYGDGATITFNRTLPAAAAVADDQTTDGSWWMSLDPGPGITITKNQNSLYVQWFGFDRAGMPTWYISPDCQLTGTTRNCTGDVLRKTLRAVNGVGSVGETTKVGVAKLDFQSAYAGVFTVDIGTTSRKANIERELALDP